MASATKSARGRKSNFASRNASPSKSPHRQGIPASRLKARKPEPKPEQPSPRKGSNGLSVRENWLAIFKANEKLRETDEKLCERMLRLYPHKRSLGLRDYSPEGCQAVRRWINSGRPFRKPFAFKRYGPDKQPLLRRAPQA